MHVYSVFDLENDKPRAKTVRNTSKAAGVRRPLVMVEHDMTVECIYFHAPPLINF